jgi:hypothetical protein
MKIVLTFLFTLPFALLCAQNSNWHSEGISPSPLPTASVLSVSKTNLTVNEYYKGRAVNDSSGWSGDEMVKTGKILTYIGGALFVGGLALVLNSDALYYRCMNGTCTGDPKGAIGVTMVTTATTVMGVGIPIWVMGAKKRK